MELSDEGFMRPVMRSAHVDRITEDERSTVSTFKEVCPGRRLRSCAPRGLSSDPIIGTYIAAWKASATDSEVRFAGSSGGVLTALSGWLIDTEKTQSVIGSSVSAKNASRTVPVRIVSKEEALRSAGSRYAPVCNLPEMAYSSEQNALVGKPCEVSAAAQLYQSLNLPKEQRPLLLSFFCAGTPSQWTTDQMIEELGVSLTDVRSVRYRGNGWPGRFEVTSVDGTSKFMSYEDSWGNHLGRNLQIRCKLCVDGTGGHADIAVGDFWHSDSSGFPLFKEAEGNSVLIARSARGNSLILEAAKEGIINLAPIDMRDVTAVQPLQVDRKKTLIGRMIGRLAAGKRIPLYFGYGLIRLAIRIPVRTLRAAAGTFIRTMSAPRNCRTRTRSTEPKKI